MNKRQCKKNIRKQTMLLSRSELARLWVPGSYKRRKHRLDYIIRLYKKSGPIVYKHFKYSDYAREYIKTHPTEPQPLPKLWRMK